MLSTLKSKVASVCDEVFQLDVPESLKFGSFDTLIKLVDDLGKADAAVEAVLRRIERQMLELDPVCDFKVLFRQKTLSVENYVRSFAWDDAKFPRSRSVGDNLSQLLSAIGRCDEDVKSKAYQFVEVKTSLQNLSKVRGPGVSFANAELADILTPEIVSDGDFVTKEHLMTVLVIVPKGQEKDFLKTYENSDKFVVPRSAKQFQKLDAQGRLIPLLDKDGSALWRVILFKNAIEPLRKTLRDNAKCTIREYIYSPTAFTELVAQTEALNGEYEKTELALKRHCAAAFSDTLVGFLHLKAMRVFVESVLRYGVPASFTAFVVRPTSTKNLSKLRSILAKVFSNSALFGQSYLATNANSADTEDGEAYYPYVNLAFTPLTPAVAA